jgi:hypothetical protein
VTEGTAPRTAARALAAELKLPSWKGTVMTLFRSGKYVLVVAADSRWLRQVDVPADFHGYPVIVDKPLNVEAHAR